MSGIYYAWLALAFMVWAWLGIFLKLRSARREIQFWQKSSAERLADAEGWRDTYYAATAPPFAPPSAPERCTHCGGYSGMHAAWCPSLTPNAGAEFMAEWNVARGLTTVDLPSGWLEKECANVKVWRATGENFSTPRAPATGRFVSPCRVTREGISEGLRE